MKFVQIAVVLSVVVLSATVAQAQFGLYGSPEVLDFSQPDPAAAPYGGYAVPASYPARPLLASRQTDIAAEPAPPVSTSLPPDLSESVAPAQSCAGLDVGACGACGCAPGCCDEGCTGECDTCGGCGECGCGGSCCCPWYGLTYALIMGRNNGNRLWTSYNWGDEPDQVEHTQIGMTWQWGGEIRIGRRCCCDTKAIEFTYWTLDAFVNTRTTTHENNLGTPLTIGHLSFDGNPATEWFDGALEHRLRRYNEFHNAEVNLLRQRLLGRYDVPLDLDLMVGVRYFRFEEELLFGTTADPTRMSDPTLPHDAYLNEHITNQLFGMQVGFDANYRVGPHLRMFITPKSGVYNNQIDHLFQVYLNDNGLVPTQTYYPGRTYPVGSSTNVVSFLTQVDVGLDWEINQNWSARLGYRVVAATGMGLADNQIPPYIVDIPEIARIDYNGELVLHGAFFGVAYNY